MELSAEKLCKNLSSLQSSRTDFDSLYQTLHDYYYVNGDNITAKDNKGKERHHLLDATSLTSGNVLSSGLSNYLTPEASKWFFLEHPNKSLREKKAVQQWMKDTTDEVLLTLSGSNFYNQMPIFYKASGIYGTSGLFCEKDEDDGVRFYNVPIRKLYLTEDAKERPNEFYLIFEYTSEQAYGKFGDNVSREVKESYLSGTNEDKKYKYICYLGKRNDIEPGKEDKLNMPIRMVWVEDETKKIVKEDGYRTMPAVAHRFYKQPQIVYGYSPAMDALPYVRLTNVIADTVLRSSMKNADPAIALPDDAFIGTPNFNPRQINYYQRGKLDASKDIIPLGVSGNINIGINELKYYQDQIKEIMFVNTFQAFGDITKQMTVPEVMERVNEKMTLLGPAVGRYMNDVLQPLIERVVMILFEDNRLPKLPDEMIQDPNFEVKFVGRLVQSQRQSEINNIVSALSVAGQIAQFKPEVLDIIDGDKAVQDTFDIYNVNPAIVKSNEEVLNIRKSREQNSQMNRMLAAANSASGTYKNVASGEKDEQTA